MLLRQRMTLPLLTFLNSWVSQSCFSEKILLPQKRSSDLENLPGVFVGISYWLTPLDVVDCIWEYRIRGMIFQQALLCVALWYRAVFVQTARWPSSPVLMPLCRHFSNDLGNLQWLRLNLCFPIHLLHIQPISGPTFSCQALRLGATTTVTAMWHGRTVLRHGGSHVCSFLISLMLQTFKCLISCCCFFNSSWTWGWIF